MKSVCPYLSEMRNYEKYDGKCFILIDGCSSHGLKEKTYLDSLIEKFCIENNICLLFLPPYTVVGKKFYTFFIKRKN